MKHALLRGLIVGGILSAVYLAGVTGWLIGRWWYFTFG